MTQRTLIRGATVITMDAQGDLPQADILVTGDTLTAIAPSMAPIIVAAAATTVPMPLLEQLAEGGRLILPVGAGDQTLRMIEHQPQHRFVESKLDAVRFVPLLNGPLA